MYWLHYKANTLSSRLPYPTNPTRHKIQNPEAEDESRLDLLTERTCRHMFMNEAPDPLLDDLRFPPIGNSVEAFV